MAASAYLLIRAADGLSKDGHGEALEGLWALPEVEYAEPVSGLFDCVAKVEAPTARLALLAHKVRAKSWVEDVQVLKVDEPIEQGLEWEETRAARLTRDREIVKAFRRSLQRQSVSSKLPYAARAAAIRAELEEARSLERQLRIIRAYCQKRHTRGKRGPGESS